MRTKKEIRKFRKALKEFALIKLAYNFDKGEMDSELRSFCEGDSLRITLTIDLLPNDIIFMRSLSGQKITRSVLRKVKKMWDDEKKDLLKST